MNEIDYREYFLDIERFQNLANLGVRFKHNPSCCWVSTPGGRIKKVLPNTSDLDHLSFVSIRPAFTLQEILELLPTKVNKYSLNIHMKRKEIEYIDEKDVLVAFSFGGARTMLDAAYDALCWITKKNNAQC